MSKTIYRAAPKVGAVVVAAGASSRMGKIDKAVTALGGRPLIWHILNQLNNCELINIIALVMSTRNLVDGQALVNKNKWEKVIEVVEGGPRRQDSVLSGLKVIGDTSWTIVHDGARPFIDQNMIKRGLSHVKKTGAAVAAIPITSTVKSVDRDMKVTRTLDRDRLWSIQTPQVFDTQLLKRAHSEISENVTDDSTMVEAIGNKVQVFMGSYDNLKVTTPEDLYLAECIYRIKQTTKGNI